jgi:plasmid stability protein
MPDILVRSLSADTVSGLKQRAKSHGRSLQAETRLLLEQAANSAGVLGLLDAWERRLSDRQMADSTDLIRGDRDR